MTDMDDAQFQKTIKRFIEMRRNAFRLFDLPEDADLDEIKSAWRAKCMETHPDRNSHDPEAQRNFKLVNCAYRLLTEGIPCEELLNSDHDEDDEEGTANSKYNRSNSWGYHLWWRENFF